MQAWKTKQLTYEGCPLYLRYQENLDFDTLQKKYIKLVTITHSFSKVMTNGLPEPLYNRGLFSFDMALRKAFDEANIGITPLIETFGGQRNYYVYVLEDTNVEAVISQVRQDFPFDISLDVQPDSEWSFIRRYVKDFLG